MKSSESKQIIIVKPIKTSENKALLFMIQKEEGKWRKLMGPVNARVGRKGITKDKIEGDEKTPSGLFRLGYTFGKRESIENKKVEYRMITQYDYWIDDINSEDYNRWVRCYDNPKNHWKSYETMNIPEYKLGVVVKYNMDPVIKGRGSAIFIHVWQDSMTPTSGCIAIDEENMYKLINLLDVKKRPKIIIN
jgi:L,D-peptidoglycan transpeptidase YkuD (ErfK/YbiS/YcfS/YnhG family)